ncbi:PQQ-binding-like beta-propeller repeat protein [Micromonospora sp. NPDC005806]|uniref:outer membrane protein assembly factor BamB family protein n=1 Tax=Micromonospora sp. NPDC005806 TaxID=3364234 RepID=UPI00368A4AB5
MADGTSHVIELGEMPHDEKAEPLPGPRRPPGPTVRVAALCGAALLTLAGAAPVAHRPPGVPVPAPQGASFAIVAGRLVVADGPGTVGRDGRVVTGHRLPGGESLWQFVLPAGDHVLGLSSVADVLLVTTSPAGAGDTISTALDPASGTVRWRQAGYPVPTESGGVLFEMPRADGTGTIRSVDLASGAARWSLPLPGNGVAYRRGDRGVTEIVLVSADGRVAVHDAGSGTLRHAGRVPPAADRVSYRFTQVVADLLLVDGGPGVVTAYGLDRLDRRWTVPVPLRSAAWFTDCAGVLCLHDESGGARTFDPATGRQLWTDDRWLGVTPVDDRLLAAAPAIGLEMELATLDPRTGRVLARFGRWRLGGADRSAPRQLGLRRLPDDRTLVVALDLPAGQVRFRAVLPGSGDDCMDAGTALVCLRPSGGMVLWPVEG